MEFACVLKATPNNPDIGDMQLDDAGNPIVLSELGAEVAQRLTVSFNFFLGEWSLDLDEGTPWFQYILVKAPQDRLIRTVFTQVITSVEGVDELLKFAYSISKDRHMTVTFEARLKDGTIFKSSNYARFVVAV